jgi:hypothetical protein
VLKIPCNNQSIVNGDESMLVSSSWQHHTLARHSFEFDPSVIVECNSRGELHLNKCPASLQWRPETGSCVFKENQQEETVYERLDSLNENRCKLECQNDGICDFKSDGSNQIPVCLCAPG